METTYFAGAPRADLVKKEFDSLIHQKGRDVIFEKALQCPCKSKSANQQSGCRNCGGSGWVFINPKRTRMILTSIEAVTEYRPWSEELRGTVNITSHVEDELSIMDRITALDGESIHNEVLFFDEIESGEVFSYSTYNIKEVLYIAMFQGINSPLLRLVEGVDYTIRDNVINLLKQDLPFADPSENNITIKYKHAPQFHVIEMKRDTMQTFSWDFQGEKVQQMPVSAIGRRSHYQLSAQNLEKNRLINNSFEEKPC